MKPLDLITFAVHSEKLPETFLIPNQGNRKNEVWKIFAAHWIDFTIVVAVTNILTFFFHYSIKSVLMTETLHTALSYQQHSGANGFILPFLLFSYFFFCQFMNHGQTIGMYFLKKRILMSPKNFEETFRWATHSIVLCLSFGLSYLMTKEKWNSVIEHDYLYSEFMSYKESTPINLLAYIEINDTERTSVNEEWKKAA